MVRVGRRTDGKQSDIRVLHVDDDAEFADLAKTFLQRESDRIQVTTVTDATAGLDALAAGDFDCVVSDYDMPDQDGIKFLESVRETHPDVPFLLYTGKGSEEIASEAISAGVTDYLQKQSGTNQYTLLANRIENAVERERSGRELAERNRRLETLIQNLPGMVYRCANEPNWPMEFVGGECETLTGYSAHTLETQDGLWGNEIIHPDDGERAWTVVQDSLEAEQPFELTYKIQSRDGTVKEVWERGRGIYGADGSLEALEGFITDVTDQKRYERELYRLTAEYETVFEHARDAIFLVDVERTDAGLEFVYRRRNDAHESVTGVTDEIRGSTPADIFDEALSSELREHYHDCVETATAQTFEAEVASGGGVKTVSVRLSPVVVGGEVTQVVGISRPVDGEDAFE